MKSYLEFERFSKHQEYWDQKPRLDSLLGLPICEICDNEDELLDEIMVTVVHEVAHHFGIDDETLHQLGWD